MDRISESIRQALSAADSSNDIHDIVENARAALVEADAVSLFGIETPHPDFGSVHWIVGRTDPPDGDYLVFGIPERASNDGGGDDGWPVFSAGAGNLSDAFRLLSDGMPKIPADIAEPQGELVAV